MLHIESVGNLLYRAVFRALAKALLQPSPVHSATGSAQTAVCAAKPRYWKETHRASSSQTQ